MHQLQGHSHVVDAGRGWACRPPAGARPPNAAVPLITALTHNDHLLPVNGDSDWASGVSCLTMPGPTDLDSKSLPDPSSS
jgi:hypothetical protein